MASLNKVQLIWNIGKEPEIRAAQNNTKEIANLTIATSESWKDKATGEKHEKTEWHRVVIFNEKLVEICKKYLHKGSKVYIEGQLQTRKWTDASGVERYTTEVVLQNFGGTIVMLGGKAQESAPATAVTPPAATSIPDDPFDDEIPF